MYRFQADHPGDAPVERVDPTPRSAPVTDGHGTQILIAHGEQHVASALAALLHMDGYDIMLAHERQRALRLAVWQQPSLIILDTLLPGGGIEMCASLKNDPRMRLVPIVMITSDPDTAERLSCIAAGADEYIDITDESALLTAQVDALLRKERWQAEYDMLEQMVAVLTRTLAAYSPLEHHHSQRLAFYALLIGQQLAYNETELNLLRYGAMLHDIGKIGVNPSILSKSGRLTLEERRQIQQHPLLGEQIVQPLRMGPLIGSTIRSHHERWDGCGYPDRLCGAAIPLNARVVAVLDAFDAMTTNRPYKAAISHAAALAQLEAGAGTQWDPGVVEAFTSCFQEHTLRSCEDCSETLCAIELGHSPL